MISYITRYVISGKRQRSARGRLFATGVAPCPSGGRRSVVTIVVEGRGGPLAHREDARGCAARPAEQTAMRQR
jgi:hypothetical protein